MYFYCMCPIVCLGQVQRGVSFMMRLDFGFWDALVVLVAFN